MSDSGGSRWRNCAVERDAEMEEIDRLEAQIASVSPPVAAIRDLISSLELCHHKAERWIHNIVEAIGAEQTNKGLGTRPAGACHPAEEVWRSVGDVLSSWCDVAPASVPVPRLLEGLGDRSALKVWQVRRVVERVRSLIGWPVTAPYEYLLLGCADSGCLYLSECPVRYREDREFWLVTARTIIHDTQDGVEAGVPLALAIDMLWPCHWRFLENLRIVLGAIGGRLRPDTPFAACARNIALLPHRERMETIARTLRVFSGRAAAAQETEGGILSMLGQATIAKKWLAACLDKTIRLQMNPPAEVRCLSSLSGPEWAYRD